MWVLPAPLTRKPQSLSRNTPGQGHPHPQQQRSVVQRWPFSRFHGKLDPWKGLVGRVAHLLLFLSLN